MARLFVALELPEPMREAIAAWQRGFDPALRPVRPEGLHVTLAFLGSRDETEIDAIAEAAFARVDSPAPEIELDSEPVARPSGKRPSLYALEARSGSESVEAVQRQVVAGLAEADFHEPEDRPFWTHVTVARVRPAKRGSRKPGVVERAPETAPPNVRSQIVRPTRLLALTLFRSHTKREGAVYEPMAVLELPPAETER